MEFKKTLIGILLFTALFILLASCEQNDGRIYETTSKDRIRTTTIDVTWVDVEDIDSKCKSLGLSSQQVYRGCARTRPNDVTVCEVYAVRPGDFDDRDTLYHFGHEVWHCLGARHR